MASPRLTFLVLTAAATLAASQTACTQTPAGAQMSASTQMPASTQTSVSPSGRLLASNCFQCHGTNGNGPGFDKLTGKSADKLFQKMKKYQSGEKSEGIMARHAMGYSDAQLREMSEWLSQQQR